MRWMTGWITSLALALAAATALAQADALVVGAVVSQSGPQAARAAEYRKALLLWQDQINAAGGLLGRTVELRLKDDSSEAVRAGAAYAELIKEGAQVLIGPYGSAATLTGAAEAERAQRVMLNAGGPSSEIHKRAPQYVFQTVAPYSAYAEGVLALAREAGAQSLYILARDDAADREMAEAAQTQAQKLGFAGVQLEVYSGRDVDYLPQLYNAMQVQADAWIAFGEVRDGADMVKTLKRQGYVPKLLYLRSSADPRFVQLVGQDAESILASEEYDPRFPYDANSEFVKAYSAKWSARPGALAAAAYAAGQVLAEAVRRAGTVQAQKLRVVLAELEIDTVLGPYRVDAASGAQLGMKPAVVQMVKGRVQPLWPASLADDRRLAPFVSWADRVLLK